MRIKNKVAKKESKQAEIKNRNQEERMTIRKKCRKKKN